MIKEPCKETEEEQIKRWKQTLESIDSVEKKSFSKLAVANFIQNSNGKKVESWYSLNLVMFIIYQFPLVFFKIIIVDKGIGLNIRQVGRKTV